MDLAEMVLAEVEDNYNWKVDAQIQLIDLIILPLTNGVCAVITDTMQQIARLADARLGASQQFASQIVIYEGST
ncbi:hypothetical protein R1flu_009044 [Riccia fluitans]|uniref:Uncharacterized protein n=1 Tax=Riccia fluitans TaxID=41844 RepID=A0ABD1Z0Y9_9MARC